MANLPRKHLELGLRACAAALGLVMASCGGGGGGSSAPVTPPSAPAGLSAASGNSQVSLTWSAASGASTYNLYWGTATGVTKAAGTKVAGVTSPYSHAGLTNGTTYYYVVSAANSAGESAASAEAHALPWITAPTGVQATPGDTSVTLSWSPVDGATSYACYWGTTTPVTLANSTEIASVTSPYIKGGLNNGQNYYFAMTASDAHGESPFATEAHAVPAVIAAPAAPSGVTGTLSGTVGSFDVTLARGAKTKLTATPVTAATYQDSTVANATAYYYQVTALNAGGESVGSSEITVPVINLSGTTWSILETVLSNSCGTSIPPVTNTATITQAVGTNTFSGTLSGGGTFTGTISGQTVTIQGSEPYTASGYNGTLNFHVTSGTWAKTASAITLNGNATWSFVYGGTTYCTGTMTLAGSMNQ